MPVRFRNIPYKKKNVSYKSYSPKEKDLCKLFYHQVRLRQQFNLIRNNILIFHIANESIASDAYRIQLKAMGVIAGIPDYCVLLAEGRVGFIEFKRNSKSPISKAQRSFALHCNKNNIPYILTWEIEQAFKFIEGL